MSFIAPFARPLYVMAKPVGAHCNLYEEVPRHVMSDDLLEKFVREYIQSQTMSSVLFTWHRGAALFGCFA